MSDKIGVIGGRIEVSMYSLGRGKGLGVQLIGPTGLYLDLTMKEFVTLIAMVGDNIRQTGSPPIEEVRRQNREALAAFTDDISKSLLCVSGNHSECQRGSCICDCHARNTKGTVHFSPVLCGAQFLFPQTDKREDVTCYDCLKKFPDYFK